jgi:glycosyltransferase involved in cell wall biosynthesis
VKKLAILCNGYGLINRGAERLTDGIYNLLKNDYEVEIYSALRTQTKTRKEIKLPWRNGKAYLESYYFAKEWTKVDTNNYDLVINNAGFPGSYWCNKYRNKTGTPFITLERGGGREERINNLFKPNCMVFLTNYSMKKSPYGKKVVLPVGVDMKKFSTPREPVPELESLQHPIFLSTSAMIEFKHIDYIIDAIETYGKGTLIQTSTGNKEEELDERGEEKLGKRYVSFGVVPDETLISLYQHSDYLVSASLHEAFGNIYLEAMSAGLPVIAQRDERRKEIIGDAGFLVDWQNDTDELAKSFDSFKIEKGKVLEQAMKYDWDTLKPKYIDLIETVINEK